ncbi:Uncharacterised protein [Myroides odoratus]|nr:hypothetical protein Myrod_0798 [Myroides odoratus DSM 2801]EKB08876.1 hypothetical protein HMPREF9716_00646 [Myroides odoratus CIP 103059]STZ28893.1 Uncharacterised protein [Myroides odoratus]
MGHFSVRISCKKVKKEQFQSLILTFVGLNTIKKYTYAII